MQHCRRTGDVSPVDLLFSGLNKFCSTAGIQKIRVTLHSHQLHRRDESCCCCWKFDTEWVLLYCWCTGDRRPAAQLPFTVHIYMSCCTARCTEKMSHSALPAYRRKSYSFCTADVQKKWFLLNFWRTGNISFAVQLSLTRCGSCCPAAVQMKVALQYCWHPREIYMVHFWPTVGQSSAALLTYSR